LSGVLPIPPGTVTTVLFLVLQASKGIYIDAAPCLSRGSRVFTEGHPAGSVRSILAKTDGYPLVMCACRDGRC
jgi:hypothetical protein